MDLIIVFIICFVMLIASVLKGIFVGYPLMVGLLLFIVVGVKMGYSLKKIIYMAYEGGKKAAVVLKIFMLIGAITAVWISCGTVPAIVYYGIKLLIPGAFILSAFLISCFVSFLLGTSFGTVGTVGISLMVLARTGGVNTSAAAGAIIAGAYFGDRCSPMSSSANLVAILTETDLYTNIKNMFKTAAVPFIFSIPLYLMVSMRFPLNAAKSGMGLEISKNFNVGIVVLIPALIILLLSLFKINVKLSMFISIILACGISIFVQKDTLLEVLKYLIFGFTMEKEGPLTSIMKGGGIISMVKPAIVVFISSAFTGIFDGTEMLKKLEKIISKPCTREQAFLKTCIVSLASSAFGCTQTLAIILTHMLSEKAYDNNNIEKSELAVDIENTAVVLPLLVPWNIALFIPLVSLQAGYGSIIYLFYLYLIPVTNYLWFVFIRKRGLKELIG
jgi:Na+:H+ antiporter, NhaC family